MPSFNFFDKKKKATSSPSANSSITYNEAVNDDGNFSRTIDPIVRRRLVRKLDLRIIPWAILASFASKIDRSNLRKYFIVYCLFFNYESIVL